MSISASDIVLGKEVRFEDEKFFVLLEDGREIGVPYSWFPRLANATEAERKNWRFIGKGMGIHWEDIDEDISITLLLQPVSRKDAK
ncbi:MAG: DUF2442 domain-containing protein [Phaeodactylibacter sp.]|nr:DUF2442 domain-containing protein [Phaeodactylibacter sp.]